MYYNIKEATSNSDLEAIALHIGLEISVLNHHELKNVKCKQNGMYIFNINANKPMGHWVGCVIRKGTAFYCDSYAVKPSQLIIDFFCRAGVKWTYNKNDIQHIDAVSCGYFCLVFLHFMRKNASYYRMYQFTRHFYNDTKKNDELIELYLKTYF